MGWQVFHLLLLYDLSEWIFRGAAFGKGHQSVILNHLGLITKGSADYKFPDNRHRELKGTERNRQRKLKMPNHPTKKMPLYPDR